MIYKDSAQLRNEGLEREGKYWLIKKDEITQALHFKQTYRRSPIKRILGLQSSHSSILLVLWLITLLLMFGPPVTSAFPSLISTSFCNFAPLPISNFVPFALDASSLIKFISNINYIGA